jgi:hypothetical protein
VTHDFVLLDGDQALFLPNFGTATVVVQPGRLTGSGPMKSAGRRVCVDGDEGSVIVPGCLYMTPQYSIPGSGTLAISSLASDQLAPTSTAGGAKMMVKGSGFTAKFSVQVPAMQPPPGPGSPIPDATPVYSGSGWFQSSNIILKAG